MATNNRVLVQYGDHIDVVPPADTEQSKRPLTMLRLSDAQVYMTDRQRRDVATRLLIGLPFEIVKRVDRPL